MIVRLLRTVASASVSLALLGGCGGGSAVPSQSPAGTLETLTQSVTMMPSANHYGEDLMFSAQPYGDDIGVYKRSGFTLTPLTTISYGVSGPQGSVATVNGFVYVSNGGHSNVLVYRVKKKKIPKVPIETLDDYGQDPVNVAATPNRNLVAVSNGMTVTGGAGSVSVYLSRQSEPYRVLTYGSDQLQGEGAAIDHQGNCFWSFNDPNTQSGSIVEFTGCSGNGTVIVSGIPSTGGIAFDQSDDLYYINQISKGSLADGVYACLKLSNCGPFVTGSKYFTQPTNMNFDYKGKALWVADAAGYIDAIDLKGHGGHYGFYQFPSAYGDPYGVAPEPGE